MTINAADIKLLESEVMTDATDGGGRRTTNVIPDGVAGNIFAKVSRLDAVYGRVNLIKIFGHVDSVNVDTYAGAHILVTDPPDNPKIGVVLFSTGSSFDTRTAARDRIESYVIAGPESRMTLYGRQLSGSKAVLVYQRLEESLPGIGDVLCLSSETNGVATQQQFIRVQGMSYERRTFTDEINGGEGTFERNVITLELSAALKYTFTGPESPSRYSSVAKPTKVRTTTVADAARYFGVQPLAVAALAGALSLKVPTVYAPIVPTTQREVPVALAQMRGTSMFQEAGATFTFSTGGFDPPQQFPSGVLPGSFTLVGNGSGYPITDNGQGSLVFTGRTDVTGDLDYDTGLVTGSLVLGSAGNSGWTATHGVRSGRAAHTDSVDVTLASRGTVYSLVLSPVPAAGTTTVDFRALGQWYRLSDSIGDGTLMGDDPADGVGSIDYNSGALVVTLGALPDIDSKILTAWGSGIHSTKLVGTAAAADAKVQRTVANLPRPIVPGTLVLTETGQYLGTATDSAGVVTGPGLTGTINYETGRLLLQYETALPDPGTLLQVAYDQRVPVSGASGFTFSLEAASSLSLGVAIRAGSLRLQVPVTGTSYLAMPYSGFFDVTDDGLGALYLSRNAFGHYDNRLFNPGDAALSGVATPDAAELVGSVNYTTGDITLSINVEMTGRKYIKVGDTWQWLPATFNATLGTGMCTGSYGVGASFTTVPLALTFTAAQAPFRVSLFKNLPRAIKRGSFIAEVGAGNARILLAERGTGVVYCSSSADESVFGWSAPIALGTINYTTGEVQFSPQATELLGGASAQINVNSAVTVLSAVADEGPVYFTNAVFRTIGSPVRLGSFYIQAQPVGGGSVVSGVSDEDGIITGGITGTIDQDMGIVTVTFSPPVWADTVRYSCVVLTNLPLDSEILGLDPVRLPADGRVPIFRPGDVAVVHDTNSTTLVNPVVASATYSASRTDVADLWLVDAANARVAADKYAVDLVAGTVTMAASLDLTGVPQPLVAKDRVEDMVMLTDVEINGDIELAQPLSRNYGTDAYLSSALLFGDLYARVSSVFDQQTWTGVWSDTLIGSEAAWQYNTVLYPIEVLNSGAVTERWRLQFTSTTDFQCIGENSGVIATGTIGSDFGPVNPLTLEPYFVIRMGGWGGGQAVGNNLRFNTYGATAPIWAARTILPGATLAGDSVDIQLRGDVDA
jgi:hypothetical protein